MTKLTDTQARLLAYINEGHEVYVTMWGGQVWASSLPFGNVSTVRRLAQLGLVKKANHGTGNTTYYSRKDVGA